MTIHKRSWKKSLSSAAVCLVVVFFVYYEAMALIPWYFARDLGRDHPELGRTPVQMPDINVATLNGKLWQSFGCTLELPWKEVKKDRIGKSFEVRTFEEGAGVIFFASDFPHHSRKGWDRKAENGKGLGPGESSLQIQLHASNDVYPTAGCQPLREQGTQRSDYGLSGDERDCL
jgi:hypothetical protein